jgi:sulfur-carrier protein
MTIEFYLAGYLSNFANGQSTVRLQSTSRTVGEVLQELFALHPGVRDRIMTEQGQIRTHVNVFLGSQHIKAIGGLDASMSGESEISILPAVSGG